MADVGAAAGAAATGIATADRRKILPSVCIRSPLPEDDFDRALADFDQAIKLDPGYTAAFTNRGLVYEARAEARYKADIERAKAEYKAALALPQKYSSGKTAHETARDRLDELAEERSRPSPAQSSFEKDQKLCNSSGTPIDEGIAACTRRSPPGASIAWQSCPSASPTLPSISKPM